MSNEVTLTIDEIIYGLTPAQVKSKIYEILGRLLVSTTNWKPGGVVRLMIAACSVVLSALSVLVALVARSAFLTYSSGDWLTLVAFHVYGVTRNQASFASGTIRLVNTQGGMFDFATDEAIFANTETGKTYRNSAPFLLGIGGTVTVDIRATEAGSASSCGPGTITTLVTSMIGVTATNPVTLVGNDVESDQSLIARCQLKPQALSPNGARGAYDKFAREAVRQDGTEVGVNRVAVSYASMLGETVVTVATSSGEVTGDAYDPATDLGAVFANIAGHCLPGAVSLWVRTATARTINVRFWCYFDKVVMSSAEQERIAGPIIMQWFEDLAIGGTSITGVVSHKMLRDTLRDTIAGAFTTKPLLVVVLSPDADVSLDETDVATLGSLEARAA